MPKRLPNISNEAVAHITNKTWDDWFALLDAIGASTMGHSEIIRLIRNDYGVNAWWSEAITQQYQHIRQEHIDTAALQHQITLNKIYYSELAVVYNAWHDAELRKQWLATPKMETHQATFGKSLRMISLDDYSHIDLYFYTPNAQTVRLQLLHRQLTAPETTEQIKNFWAQQLAALSRWLESHRT